MGACAKCGWSQGLCKCDPVLLCSKCGVAKAYHDKKNIMTKDHKWIPRKPDGETPL